MIFVQQRGRREIGGRGIGSPLGVRGEQLRRTLKSLGDLNYSVFATRCFKTV